MAKTKKVRLISPLARIFLNLAINILNTATKHIPVTEVKEGVLLLIEPLKETVRVLSDKNPENAKQLEGLWLNFLRSDEFTETTEARILQAVSYIEDVKAKDFVLKIIKPVLATMRALYDADPNNVQQIRKIWTEFLTEKQNIKSGLAFLINDEDALEDVAAVVDNIHDTIAAILAGELSD